LPILLEHTSLELELAKLVGDLLAGLPLLLHHSQHGTAQLLLGLCQQRFDLRLESLDLILLSRVTEHLDVIEWWRPYLFVCACFIDALLGANPKELV
jgi:hypothetical protein